MNEDLQKPFREVVRKLRRWSQVTALVCGLSFALLLATKAKVIGDWANDAVVITLWLTAALSLFALFCLLVFIVFYSVSKRSFPR